MSFNITPSNPVPIYRQIVDEVRRRIAGGQLAAGDELPSVRAVALEHAINPMTVSKAYSLLEGLGLLERRRGMGMVIAAQATAASDQSPAQKLALLQPTLQAAADQAAQLGLSNTDCVALLQQCLRAARQRT